MSPRFFADLHIHSRYSIACSKSITPEILAFSAAVKGLQVLGTGDCIHPAWRRELQRDLVAVGNGLFRLKEKPNERVLGQLPSSCRREVQFLLSTEISTIYKKDGRTRKVHHLVCLPDFTSAGRLAKRLSSIGSIASDGRPILKLDSRRLLEWVLALDNGSFLIPAHIWTPWFSVLGEKGGFDSLEVCYGDLTSEIFALETGLSSDPPMNWRVSALDRFSLVSNSDAHSPAKIGRECTIFTGEKSFHGIRHALETGEGLQGTVEFFPEEGKYHYDGHRKCGVRLHPQEADKLGGVCPVCGKPLTVGVLHRVEALADRKSGEKPAGARRFTRLVGLDRVLSLELGCGETTKKVQQKRAALLDAAGPELYILMEAGRNVISGASTAGIACSIMNIRRGRVEVQSGYDGLFGKITIL